MTSVRRLRCDDLLRFNAINLDELTETYGMPFYLQYLAKWPRICFAHCHGPSSETRMAYIMGKAEGRATNWHGHVTAVTVAPEFRRLGLAGKLMDTLERVSDVDYRGYFVDLFVRSSNALAIGMYERMGYVTYRRVLDYYAGEEDALDMRKALSRDPTRSSMVPRGRDITPSELY